RPTRPRARGGSRGGEAPRRLTRGRRRTALRGGGGAGEHSPNRGQCSLNAFPIRRGEVEEEGTRHEVVLDVLESLKHGLHDLTSRTGAYRAEVSTGLRHCKGCVNSGVTPVVLELSPRVARPGAFARPRSPRWSGSAARVRRPGICRLRRRLLHRGF